MADLFIKVLNMSISAGWLVLTVVFLRFLMKKAPKWMMVFLWGIVAIRLICPISLESTFSLIPSAETIPNDIMMNEEPVIHSGIAVMNQFVNPMLSESFAPDPTASANPLQIWIPVLANVWCVGIVMMVLYTVVTYVRLHRQVEEAVLLRENIFQTEQISMPFVLGMIRPKIYLPYSLEESNKEYVIAHEQAHIQRKDHWWKPLGFLLLMIYWFHPLLWIAYLLLCRDIELACDEKVIREFDDEQKAEYSLSLLSCSIDRKRIAACPLAFGEAGVKERVKAVISYRKPALGVIAAAAVLSIALAFCFLTNPVKPLEDSVVKDEDTFSSKISEIVPGTTYVSDKCIYMNLLSSYYSAGGNSGIKYVAEENSWNMSNREYGGEERIEVEKWEWQEFPYSDKRWKDLMWFQTKTYQNLREQYEELLYQPLNDQYFLMSADGELWIVQLKNNEQMGTYIWDIYRLVPEETMGMAQWVYDPLSSARLPFFRFIFDMDDKEISAVCVDSPLIDPNTNEKVYEVMLSNGETLDWSPMDEEKNVTEAQIMFCVNGEDDITEYAGTIYITSEKGEDGKLIYTAAIAGEGLYLSQNAEQDGGTIHAKDTSTVY